MKKQTKRAENHQIFSNFQRGVDCGSGSFILIDIFAI